MPRHLRIEPEAEDWPSKGRRHQWRIGRIPRDWGMRSVADWRGRVKYRLTCMRYLRRPHTGTASGLAGVCHKICSACEIERRPRGASRAGARSYVCFGPIIPVGFVRERFGAWFDIASYVQGGRARLSQALLARNKRRSERQLAMRRAGGARSCRRSKTFAQRLHGLAASSICWQKRRRLPNGSHTCICRPQSRRSASGRA